MNGNLIVDILLFIGAAQGFLLSLVLFSMRRGNRNANRILASLLSLFSLMIFFHTSGELQGIPSDKASHEHYAQTVFSLFGPLMFFYVRALTRRQFSFQEKDLLHAVPFVVLFAVFVAFAFMPDHARLTVSLNTALPWLFMAQMTAYFYFITRLLRNHRKNIRENFSFVEKINLQWMSFLTTGQAIIWPVAFYIEMTGGGSHEWNIVWLMVSVLMYTMGYFGLRQPEIFAGKFSEGDVFPDAVRKKYEKSVLSPEDSSEVVNKLDKLMGLEKLYLNSTLSLPDLAKRLGVSTHHLSQILNESIGVNFYEYVNGKRVEEAKQMLKDPKLNHLSIAGIGFEAGFNSLSAFNAVFKKHTGSTPSAFRETRTDVQ
jgi:AraC-like DNA-binding protein